MTKIEKRQEVPDLQVLDAATQYQRAWEILDDQPLEAGILLPLINAASIAIELYLKSLSSISIYTPEERMPEVSLVTAKLEQWGHVLVKIFDKISVEHQEALEGFYKERFPEGSRGFKKVLETLEGAFMTSRYPFEKDMDITKYAHRDLKAIVTLLHEYTAGLDSVENITWEETDS